MTEKHGIPLCHDQLGHSKPPLLGIALRITARLEDLKRPRVFPFTL